MKRSVAWHVAGLVLICMMLAACGKRQVLVPSMEPPPPETGWIERTVGEEDLKQAEAMDPDLTPAVCKQILARLNSVDKRYIAESMKKGKKLKVPRDFRAYKDWTPLPLRIDEVDDLDRFILVVKDIPFLGWYANGKLIDDTQICIGKKPTWTKAGLYQVTQKDIDHISSSYQNAYGTPALMPFALQIYGRVWIHGGDVIGGYCSHGCINLPLDPSQKLFEWAECGTTVLIVESIGNMGQMLKKHEKALALSTPPAEGARKPKRKKLKDKAGSSV
ncbi:MAG: L,D-transpeptidase [Acidobacteriota bacterium]